MMAMQTLTCASNAPFACAAHGRYDPFGTYHDCKTNAPYCDDESCGAYAPCLSPKLFQPQDLDPEQWVLAAKELGVQEICLTAQHEGGFSLWPSNFTEYSVKASTLWKNGTGDVLRTFADACNKHGMGICYYLHPDCDHYSAQVLNVSAAEFSERQLGKIGEVLREYGPVNRFWFDGKGQDGDNTRHPIDLNVSAHFQKVLDLIRTHSPSTIVTGYRQWGGDLATSYGSLNIFDSGPMPNTTSMATVGQASPVGDRFYPLEQVGICMQEGPDGNSNTSPTYWFYHPKVGHANASRIFDSWLHLVGHGEVGMINIAPGRTGQLLDSIVDVMVDVGKAIRNTFTTPLASVGKTATTCSKPIELDMQAVKGTTFDYIETKEDLTKSQRITNYTVEYRRTADAAWETLVPAVIPSPHGPDDHRAASSSSPPTSMPTSPSHLQSLRDRPAGADPRDQYVGFRRIDIPTIPINETANIDAIRFVCLDSVGEQIYLDSFAVYKKNVPWSG